MPLVTHLNRLVNENMDVMDRFVPRWVLKKTGIISLSTAAVLALVYSFYLKNNAPPKQLRHLPYISRYQFMRNVFKNELFENYSKNHVMPILEQSSNGVYARPSALSWTVLLSNPLVLKQLLFKSDKSLPKKGLFAAQGTLLQRFIGNPNVVFTTGDDWRRHRKVLNPAFLRSLPVKTMAQLTAKSFELIEREGPKTVDVYDMFERWTLDVLGRTGFGFEFNALEDPNSKWVGYYNAVKRGATLPLYIFFPKFDTKFLPLFKERQKVHLMLSEFQDNLNGLIDQKRQELKEKPSKDVEDQEKDLLTLLIEDELNNTNVLSNQEIINDMIVLFAAGHDTTSNALCWGLYELAKHPNIQEKAREEALRILGDAPEDILPTADQLKQHSYINMVIKEVLRRHPPLYTTSTRLTQEDMVLSNTCIPKGTEIGFDIYNLHHNPAIWNDPYKFDPDRFLPGGEADKQEGIAWAPFSHGQRQCLGQKSSLAQQQVILCMFLRKYTWTLPKDSPHSVTPQKGGVGFSLSLLNEKLELTFEKRY